MDKDNLKNAGEKVKQVFTPARLKKSGAGLIILALIGGGAGWYHKQLERERRIQVDQARAELIIAQAEKQGISIIGEDKVRSIVAEAINREESMITYKKITLRDGEDKDGRKGEHREKDKHDKRDKHDRRSHGDRREHREPGGFNPADAEPNGAAALKPTVPNGEPPTPNIPNGASQPAVAPSPPNEEVLADAANHMDNMRVPRLRYPVYKVSCEVGNVKYRVDVNAVTGDVEDIKLKA